jgi:hypothetical protein
MIKNQLKYESIFNSNTIDKKIEQLKNNGTIIIEILENWLENHKISEEELELFNIKIKEL